MVFDLSVTLHTRELVKTMIGKATVEKAKATFFYVNASSLSASR